MPDWLDLNVYINRLNCILICCVEAMSIVLTLKP